MNSIFRTPSVIVALSFSTMIVRHTAVGGETSPASPQSAKRYLNEIFASHHVQSDILFGQASSENLYLDVYTGTGDTVKNRPLVIVIHGGGFHMGDKLNPFPVLASYHLARRGYVTASINYRLTSTFPTKAALFEAMMRALQDAKAAVRFFRKNGALYGVDTSQIFVTGGSAGSVTALHLAYLDSAEVPGYVNWSNVGSSFEGTSGNPGFSSRVQAVIGNWGALGDTAWMRKGDVPVYCVHGTGDTLVKYDSIPSYGPFQYSSKYIILAAQQKGIANGLRLFPGAGHELDADTVKQDSAINDFSAWLYTILKPTTTSVRVEPASVPSTILLHQNFPNPFNPATTIAYDLPSRMRVLLEVYNTLGQRVVTLLNRIEDAGTHEVTFDASRLASGVYFYRLTVPGAVTTRKMLLAK